MWLVLAVLATYAAASIPNSWGVNIHFTQEQPGELAMLKSGFATTRMDFVWAQIETTPGVYDFSRRISDGTISNCTEYDVLIEDLSLAGLGAYWILDYCNPLYDNGLPPQSSEAIAAFAAFAAAGCTHFQGRSIIWEVGVLLEDVLTPRCGTNPMGFGSGHLKRM
jgi:hypothetical protein